MRKALVLRLYYFAISKAWVSCSTIDIPTRKPTVHPTPTKASKRPTRRPVRVKASKRPTKSPSIIPSGSPSNSPSISPSGSPSTSPSIGPSEAPSIFPSTSPSASPSTTPTVPNKWKVDTEASSDLTDFIKKYSCPQNDSFANLIPWKVYNEFVTRSILVYVPPVLCTNLMSATPLRFILAIHGYGGVPSQEISKWHSTSLALQAVLIAPQGTLTQSNGRLGWNAIDCCGDPVKNDIDDLDFLHGLVDIAMDTLSLGDNERKDGAHFIATGFSNGGFMTSLLGLETNRHTKLIGIMPTGGYQYNLALYDGVRPLPMFAHHAGRDGVVKPDGCCNSGGFTSNCPLEIGINQPTCTSVYTAFQEWSRINRCVSTSISSTVLYTCWVGNGCQESTQLCIWTNEGHNWGWGFPGLDTALLWMQGIFASAES